VELSSPSVNILGEARCPDAPNMQEILGRDTRPVPAVLREEGYSYTGSEDIPVSRYISREWADLEVEHVWKKVWQMAGRAEDIPNVGDYFIYDIVDLSLIVVRTEPDRIQAFHNFCLHRGRKLKTDGGVGASEFKCPFHGFTWKIDGNIKHIPCRWDFEHLSDEDVHLREVKVGLWAGFVLVNMDPGAQSLESYLGSLPQHFSGWDLENRHKTAHVRKRIACNWKVGLEAFIEGYHPLATHPQMMAYIGDANSQYDNYEGENFNRMLNPMGVQSPQIEPLSEVDILAAVMGGYSQFKDGQKPPLPEGMTARAFVAEQTRKVCEAQTGVDHATISDAEMVDVIQYLLFPNFVPWGGFPLNTLVYVFRPDGRDPDSCTLDVMLLRNFDTSKPRPKSAPLKILTEEQKWADAPELVGFGPIFDQDMLNMPYVQIGMKASTATKGAISLANYQESRIRDFHRLLEKRISSGEKCSGVVQQ
jgi:phenylpropionate dioxygenase-like ring-hydroxylating dioxygenase large terminal subunit